MFQNSMRNLVQKLIDVSPKNGTWTTNNESTRNRQISAQEFNKTWNWNFIKLPFKYAAKIPPKTGQIQANFQQQNQSKLKT